MEYVTNYARQYKLTLDNPAFRSAIIKSIIKDHEVSDAELKGKWNRYQQAAGSLPIDNKKRSVDTKINNKIKHDFRGEIVATQTNYFLGRPISYNIREDAIPERDREMFTEFVDRNRLPSLDQYLAKRLSVMGKAGRLYYQSDGKLWTLNIMPYEYKVIKDDVSHDTLFALRYYDVVSNDGKRIFKQVEFYDSSTIQFFTETEGGEFVEDSYNVGLPLVNDDGTRQTVLLHGFSKVPIVEFRNNEEGVGDFDKVETLIDAYDRVASSDLDDLEDVRDTLLFLKNMNLTLEDKRRLRDAKLLQSSVDGADAKYLTKGMTDTRVADTINRIKNDIYRISRTVDFSDEKFSGAAQSGESRKYKLLSMDNNRLDKVAAFEFGLDAQLEVLATGWFMLHGVKFPTHGTSYDFQANVPNDETYWAELAQKLTGVISHRSIIDILPTSIVENTDEELERLQEEKDQYWSELYRKLESETEDTETEA